MPFKFNVGDTVHCYRENGFDFIGVVKNRAWVDEDSYEYEVTNAPVKGTGESPLLIWENEMEKV